MPEHPLQAHVLRLRSGLHFAGVVIIQHAAGNRERPPTRPILHPCRSISPARCASRRTGLGDEDRRHWRTLRASSAAMTAAATIGIVPANWIAARRSRSSDGSSISSAETRPRSINACWASLAASTSQQQAAADGSDDRANPCRPRRAADKARRSCPSEPRRRARTGGWPPTERGRQHRHRQRARLS